MPGKALLLKYYHENIPKFDGPDADFSSSKLKLLIRVTNTQSDHSAPTVCRHVYKSYVPDDRYAIMHISRSYSKFW